MELLNTVKNIIRKSKESKRIIKLSKLASKAGLNSEIVSGINYCQEVSFYEGLEMSEKMATIGNSCMTQKETPYHFWAYADKKICLAILGNSRCLINETDKSFYKLYGENCGDLEKALSCYGLKKDKFAFSYVNIPNDILVKEYYTFKTEVLRVKTYKVVLFKAKYNYNYNYCKLLSVCNMERKQFSRPEYYTNSYGYDNDIKFKNVNPEILKIIKDNISKNCYLAKKRINTDQDNNLFFSVKRQNDYKHNANIFDNIIGKVFKVKGHKDLKVFVLDVELETIRTKEKTVIDDILCDYPYNDSTAKFETMGTLPDVVIDLKTGSETVLEYEF